MTEIINDDINDYIFIVFSNNAPIPFKRVWNFPERSQNNTLYNGHAISNELDSADTNTKSVSEKKTQNRKNLLFALQTTSKGKQKFLLNYQDIIQ